MYKDLIEKVKKDIGLTDNTKDEVIELYIIEGEKQLKRHFGVDKLTSSLMYVIKDYTVEKMLKYETRYYAGVERHSGLDNYFKDSGYVCTQSKFNNKMQNSLYAVKKQKDFKINLNIERRGKNNVKDY